MTDASRRIYLGLGRAFVAIGGIVALGSVLDRALGWGLFRGSPVGTAAFLVLIGGLLLWTVRQAAAPAADAAADDAGDDTAGVAAGGAAGGAAGTTAAEPPDPELERP